MPNRKIRNRRGSSTIEFVLVSSVFLVPLLLGLFSVGFGLIRDMQGVQLTRDVGHMWARGVDFSTQANQDLLATRLAQGLSLVSNSGNITGGTTGNGVVILSIFTNIGAGTCGGCNNGGHTVLVRRVVIGNHSKFTSAYGASEAKLRLGVAVRDEVNSGRIPGPRIRAGGLELSVTGAMGDESKEHNPRIGPSTLINGPDQMREAVRMHCREGVDNIKIDVSGDPFYPSTPSHTTPMTFEEVKAAADTAHAYGRKINAHTRSILGSKYCIRARVDGLFHCEHSDEELLDMMEEAKDRIFVVPTIDLFDALAGGRASPFGITPEIAGYMGIQALIEESVRTHTELRKRGIRHLIGGDYGFAWSPHGTQANDLAHFIKYYGYSAAEALICATRYGGQAMRSEGDLGTLAAGQLADLILVNGDVLADVTIVADPARIAMVMKDGALHSISPALAAKAPALEPAE